MTADNSTKLPKGTNDLTGQTFGRLTVLGIAPKRPGQKPIRWWCRCECGNVIDATPAHLKKGSVKSCGCLNRDFNAVRAERLVVRNTTTLKKHGQTDIAEYNSWTAMRKRCLNPNHRAYHRYGGRGITICDRWLGEDGFVNFLADMGSRPSWQHTLDRIDPDGNYEASNCRWADELHQQRNRTDARLITHDGQTRCLSEWAALHRMTTLLLWQRLENGWPFELAVRVPSLSRSQRRLTLQEIANLFPPTPPPQVPDACPFGAAD